MEAEALADRTYLRIGVDRARDLLAHRDLHDALHAWLRQHGFADGDIDGIVAHRVTPLMRASRVGDKEIVAALIQAGADVHARNADGNNALWHACINGSAPVIEALITAGIDLDNQNCYGATCLMCAALRSKASLVARLLAAGASVAPRTRDGLAAIDMATTIECGELLRAARHHVMSQIRQKSCALS